MHTERLFASLSRAWRRAVTVSNAADLPREYVNVILPLMPEAAESILRALQGSEAYAEEWLLRDHAPLLARHARALMLERVFAVTPAFSPVELLARAAVSFPLEERGPFRELALQAIARTSDPDDRIEALLSWSEAEAPEGCEALVAEALALLPDVPDERVEVFVRRFADKLRPDDRVALRARVDAIADAEPTSEHLLMRCELAPPEGRAALANKAVELACATDRRRYFRTALSAERLAGFEAMRPHYERHLRELITLRELTFLLNKIGARLSVEMLDLAERRIRELADEAAPHVTTLAELSLHHATRREALRAELRERAERVVGDPARGHRMRPGEYVTYDNIDLLRVDAAMRVSAAFEGDARRSFQQRALALVERTDTGVDKDYELDTIPWGELGAALDPSLYAEAVRVALSMRHRPAALEAVGRLVAKLPASAKHLALLGLARLADGGAPERLPDALAALDTAARLPPSEPTKRPGGDRAEPPWTPRDDDALRAFTAGFERDTLMSHAALTALTAALTPAAARRAAAYALALPTSYQRHRVADALADLEHLAGAVEREALVAAMLGERNMLTPSHYVVADLARHLGALCGEGDARWSERLAAFFDDNPWDVESLLAAVTLFAPVLRRLGGPAAVTRLAAQLREPIGAHEVALPWAQSPVGSFDA